MPTVHTAEALVDAIVEYFATESKLV